MIDIDGSLGEGGGQILRTALALSLVTATPFHIHNIRANRPKPGLMRQHLACVQAAVAVGGGATCSVAVGGAGAPVQTGNTALTFSPGPVRAGVFEFAVGSAGSCALVLQTVLWPLLLASSPPTLTLRGGTHNPMAPSLTFLQALAPVFALFGARALPLWDIALHRHGFYPAGGGEAVVPLVPPIDGLQGMALMARGALLGMRAECLHAGIPKGVAERELAVLQAGLGLAPEQMHNRALRSNEGPGNALMVSLVYEHVTEVFASYGDKGLSAERVARQLVEQVRTYLDATAPAGPHLADQLMLPAALAATVGRKSGDSGSSGAPVGTRYLATSVTEHTRTNARVIEAFLPVSIRIDQLSDGWCITIEP